MTMKRLPHPNPACVTLDGHSLTPALAQAIVNGAEIKIDEKCRHQVDQARAYVEECAAGSTPIYGINTGFGYLANAYIPHEEQLQLQHNLIVSHAAGQGAPLPDGIARLALCLRLNVLLKGRTGVRWQLIEHMHALLKHDILPQVPEYGSVGASGDLAPLAHLALPLIGQGKVKHRGKVKPAKKALEEEGLTPIVLAEKEGLGLINGTQVMLAVGAPALYLCRQLNCLANMVCALSIEALWGKPSMLDPELHRLRGQPGQIACAAQLRAELAGYQEPKGEHVRLQDPYSLRCAPQVHGASLDFLEHSNRVVSRELNAATDNPLVFTETPRIVSGGNFHGQYLAIAYDSAALATSEMGNIAERRIELLLNPHMSGLKAFLSPDPGRNSGYMTLQYLCGSLVNECKVLSHPACTDSIPGNAGIEDHVSMGMTSARKLSKIAEHVKTILAAELLASAQAFDLQGRKPTGLGTWATYTALRAHVPPLGEDRVVSDDMDAAKKAVDDLLSRIGDLIDE